MFHTLTPRRLETLATLRRLTEEAGSAVHYSLVAARMRISAWTAYDLLLELEKLGLVVRRYVQDGAPTHGGRSRILFAPSGIVLVPVELAERLRRAVERFSAVADEGVAARMYLSEALQGAGGDVGLHLGYWMARLEAAGRNVSDAVVEVLDSGAVPAAKIQTLAGMGLGLVLSQLNRTRLGDRLVPAVTRLSTLLEEAQRGSDSALAALVEAARGLHAGQRGSEPLSP